MKTWQQLAISIGLGLGIGGMVGYLAKRYYEEWFYKELDAAETDFRQKINREIEARDLACKELEEMRNALRTMVDEMQYDTIKRRAEKMTDDLGYSQTGSRYVENFSSGFTDAKKQCDKLRDDILAKQNAIAEQALAEAEHPMDDGEEFEGAPRLAPNGDILDGEWDPSDEMSDDMPHERYYLGCEGDTTIRDEPYLITEHQFLYGKRDYTKCSVSYLSKDDTVLDEDDTELDQEYVGPDNLKAFEETDCPSIFIRNDQLEIDYEIMWEDLSYTHDRLGYPESEVSGQRIWRKWDKEKG